MEEKKEDKTLTKELDEPRIYAFNLLTTSHSVSRVMMSNSSSNSKSG